MSVTRIITDVPQSRVNLVLGLIRLDGGTATEEPEADGEVTIIATFPDMVARTAAPNSARRAAPSIATVAAEFPWMAIARAELGQTEIEGDGSNPRIEQYHATTHGGVDTDAVPWCSSFVNFCITKVSQRGTQSKQARSWLTWGKEARDFVPGCVVVLKRGNPPKGHVGFYVGVENANVQLLGGNQGNTVSVASYPADRVLGRRVPSVQ